MDGGQARSVTLGVALSVSKTGITEEKNLIFV